MLTTDIWITNLYFEEKHCCQAGIQTEIQTFQDSFTLAFFFFLILSKSLYPLVFIFLHKDIV